MARCGHLASLSATTSLIRFCRSRSVINRRAFLSSSVLPSLTASQKPAAPGQGEYLENWRAGSKPAIAINHLGFLPKGRKLVVVRLSGGPVPSEFILRDMGRPPDPARLALPGGALNSSAVSLASGAKRGGQVVTWSKMPQTSRLAWGLGDRYAPARWSASRSGAARRARGGGWTTPPRPTRSQTARHGAPGRERVAMFRSCS